MRSNQPDSLKALLPIFLCVFVTALGIGLVSPLVPQLIGAVVGNNRLIGLTASAMSASFVLAAWPLGNAIDRWGVKRFILAGLALYAVSLGLIPFARTLPAFLALRVLEGVGWAGVWIATETYVSWVSSDPRRGRNMAFYSIVLALGTTSGPVISYQLIKLHPTLPFAATVGVAGIAAALIVLLVREPEHDPEHSAHHTPIAMHLARPLLLPLLLAGLYGYGGMSLLALLPVSRESQEEIVLLMTTTVVASVLAQLPVNYLTERYGRRPVLLGSLGMLTAAAGAAALGPPFWLLLGLAVVLGALAGTLYPIGLAMIGERVAPRQLGLANGLYSLSYGVGSIVGPTLSGAAMDIFGPGALYSMLGVLGAGLLVALLLGVDSFRHPQAARLPEPPS